MTYCRNEAYGEVVHHPGRGNPLRGVNSCIPVQLDKDDYGGGEESRADDGEDCKAAFGVHLDEPEKRSEAEVGRAPKMRDKVGGEQ